MSDNSKIEWTDATWNPIRALHPQTYAPGWHCVKVSQGCKNCYAETFNGRFGTRLPYSATSNPLVEIDEKVLMQPLRWRKPRRVFVCSMTDLFGEWMTDGGIAKLFAIMALAPQHTFQVLTKRAERMETWCRNHFRLIGDTIDRRMDTWGIKRTGVMPIPWGDPGTRRWPLANVGIGISAEDQRTLDERVLHLLSTPAAWRFVSLEPLLGPVDASPYLEALDDPALDCEPGPEREFFAESHPGLDQLIVGGESGPKARPMHPDWARSIRDQCQAAGVAFFFKQWGAFSWEQRAYGPNGEPWQDKNEWFRRRVGKQRAGRLLDGRTWDEMPEAIRGRQEVNP